MLNAISKSRFDEILATEPPQRRVNINNFLHPDFSLLCDSWKEVLEADTKRNPVIESTDAVNILIEARRAVIARGRTEWQATELERLALAAACELPVQIEEAVREISHA